MQKRSKSSVLSNNIVWTKSNTTDTPSIPYTYRYPFWQPPSCGHHLLLFKRWHTLFFKTLPAPLFPQKHMLLLVMNEFCQITKTLLFDHYWIFLTGGHGWLASRWSPVAQKTDRRREDWTDRNLIYSLKTHSTVTIETFSKPFKILRLIGALK